MIATDFEFDGECLKDHGFIICNSEQSSGLETINSTPQLTINSVKLMNGKLFELTSVEYEDKVTISFQICKYEKNLITLLPICDYEIREIKRWLCRHTYRRFKLIQPEWSNIYMEGIFNVSEELGFDGKVYVLNLTFESNRPFAIHDPVTYKINATTDNLSYVITDISDEIGYIYPDMKITCLQSGTLEITNSNELRKTVIKNCTANENIFFTKELLLSSSIKNHKIQNDFNYTFLRISNSYRNRKNILTFSMPLKIELTYSPYVKVVS